MIFKLFRRTPRDNTIACLYGTIVAQARLPAFYQIYGVPDTVDGRLEMIMLHTVLFLRRLESEAAPIRALGQGLFDQFCRDMDDSMREMGVGDLAVPRNMRRIGEAFYGRQAAYRVALEAPNDEPLAAALDRNVFADGSEPRRPCGWRSMSAKPCVGWLLRMDSSAHGSRFPIPNRYCCARDRRG